MKLGIMQPYFFPYLGYWQLINAVDTYVIYDDVAFIKNGWINRNNILVNGQLHLLTLPLKNASSNKKINEITLDNKEKNIKKILKTLEMAYKKARYFDNVIPIIKDILSSSYKISELNYNSIKLLNKYIGIDTKIILSSEIEKDNSLKAQDKVIHINKILGSDEYINAIGGIQLYDKETFLEQNIKLRFLTMKEVQYKQYNNIFVPNLSIIDVMMFNPPEKIKEMLNDYTLI